MKSGLTTDQSIIKKLSKSPEKGDQEREQTLQIESSLKMGQVSESLNPVQKSKKYLIELQIKAKALIIFMAYSLVT